MILETIIILFALAIIGFIIIPVTLRLCKIQVWEFVKNEIEKDAKYKKMVKDILKGKK